MVSGCVGDDTVPRPPDAPIPPSLIAYKPLKKCIKDASTICKDHPECLHGLSLSLAHGVNGWEFVARLESGEQLPEGFESFFRFASAELRRIISFYVAQHGVTENTATEPAMERLTSFDANQNNRENVDEVRALADLIQKFMATNLGTSDSPDTALVTQYASSIQKLCRKGFALSSTREAVAGVPHLLSEAVNLQTYVSLNVGGFLKIFRKLDRLCGCRTQENGILALRGSPLYAVTQALSQLGELRAHLLHSLPSAEEFLCVFCQDILYNPITLQCQHSFCAWCLRQASESKMNRCPVCRHRCDLNPKHCAVNAVLAERCSHYFPARTRERIKSDAREEKKFENKKRREKFSYFMSTIF